MSGDSENAAERFIRGIPLYCKVIVLYHGDADGVCSAVMIYRCLRYRGLSDIIAFPLGRGENPFSKMSIKRLQNENPDYLIVLDSRSRKGTFQNIRCMIKDHHVPDSIPEVEVYFNTWLDKSNRITSEAVLDLISRVVPVDDMQWYAFTGAAADVGISGIKHRFAALEDVFRDFLKRLGYEPAIMA